MSKMLSKMGEFALRSGRELKDFAVKGNVVDMAVGIIIGAAFGTIVKSLVDDVIMPPIGMILGNVDFTGLFILLKDGTKALPPYNTLAEARSAGAVTINYGNFINNVVTFLIVAGAVFMLVKLLQQLKGKNEETQQAEPTTKDCPYCFSKISIKAIRCPACTSELKTA